VPDVAAPTLWVGAVAALLIAMALAWRVRAVAGLLAAGLSACGVVAAIARWSTASTALAFAALFAAVSLGATAVGALVGRLLEDDDHSTELR
jgi:hypothetical protein